MPVDQWISPGLMHDWDDRNYRPLIDGGQRFNQSESLCWPPRRLVLAAEPIPRTCFGKNMRTVLGMMDWMKIRNDLVVRAGGKCKFCGSEEQIEAHEVWTYDLKTRVQRLLDIEIVCKDCHNVKHGLRSAALSAEGKLDIQRTMDKFVEVNGCPVGIYKEQLADAVSRVRQTNQYNDWVMDFGDWLGEYNGKK